MEKKQYETPYGVKDYTRDEEVFNNEIAPRMKELILTNKWETEGLDELKDKMNKQDTLMNELKEHCRKAKAMTGRVIKFLHADSYAVYLVTKVWETKCTLEWIDYSDGWTISDLGYKGSMDINFIHYEILREDKMDELFS